MATRTDLAFWSFIILSAIWATSTTGALGNILAIIALVLAALIYIFQVR